MKPRVHLSDLVSWLMKIMHHFFEKKRPTKIENLKFFICFDNGVYRLCLLFFSELVGFYILVIALPIVFCGCLLGVITCVSCCIINAQSWFSSVNFFKKFSRLT